MQVKIDTKEKFTVVTPIQPELTANIAAEIRETASKQLYQPVKNIILNLSGVAFVEDAAASLLSELQQYFYENNASFVICCMQPSAEAGFSGLALLEMMNTTPTESEAWDIVQMEEIERELLDGEDMEFAAG
ncbi:STAS domain-containing protein [Sediminibacterium soli]|uniref:STAS domain-containing protein n=1 Tax=Sediminibacterium soli TaxID=2698829 RepID=UPI00137A85FD|nr:STAS domain-containing protein [Sediminibacterium soli]NCI46077.1 STAS domain-containing protein [Sediminibacterium soli]